MATELARMRGWCLGAVLLTGCINLDRSAPNAPDEAAATTADVAPTDGAVDDVIEVVASDGVPIETTIVVPDDATAADATDVSEATEGVGEVITIEVIGTEVVASDVQPPDATEVTACGADHCLIDGTCYDQGATDPSGAVARICNPLCSQTAWVPDCAALACIEDPFCDSGDGNCHSLEDVTHACFVPNENRCYTESEQAEGVDWPNQPVDPWPSPALNTAHQASLNPLGAGPNGGNNGDVDWLRWSVTVDAAAVGAGLSGTASARITNHTGAKVELCVLVSCGQGAVAKPLTVACSEGATAFPRVDDTRDGCCLSVSPEADKRTRTVWARPTCVIGVTQQTGFARVSAQGGEGAACGRYELAFDVETENVATP